MRTKRLFRVVAHYSGVYGDYTRSRNYQSERSAKAGARRYLEGREPDDWAGDPGVEPANKVTIAVSEPVVFGEPVEVGR